MTAGLDVPNPFELVTAAPWHPAARRELRVFGAPVELLWLPQRTQRGGVPRPGRAPFRAPVAERIIREELVWERDGVVLTPNRFPFAPHHVLLWTTERTREPTLPLLTTALSIASRHGGSVLGNSIGAAASIQRAHLHVIAERLPFLAALATEHATLDGVIGSEHGVELVRPRAFAAIGVRGDVAARAAAIHRLLELRMTAAFNLADDGTTTWVFPRGIETPTPHFPYAFGAAELVGRWCYGDEDPFRAATAQDLERALVLSAAP